MDRNAGHITSSGTRARASNTAVKMAAGCISISQINLQHCKAATDLLDRRIVGQQTDIVLIQEPWLTRGRVGGLNAKLGTVIHGPGDPGPRACVYASKRLNALRLGEFCTRDLTAVLIESKMGGNTEKIVVCSAYLPYDSEEPPPNEGTQSTDGGM